MENRPERRGLFKNAKLDNQTLRAIRANTLLLFEVTMLLERRITQRTTRGSTREGGNKEGKMAIQEKSHFEMHKSTIKQQGASL